MVASLHHVHVIRHPHGESGCLRPFTFTGGVITSENSDAARPHLGIARKVAVLVSDRHYDGQPAPIHTSTSFSANRDRKECEQAGTQLSVA